MRKKRIKFFILVAFLAGNLPKAAGQLTAEKINNSIHASKTGPVNDQSTEQVNSATEVTGLRFGNPARPVLSEGTVIGKDNVATIYYVDKTNQPVVLRKIDLKTGLPIGGGAANSPKGSVDHGFDAPPSLKGSFEAISSSIVRSSVATAAEKSVDSVKMQRSEPGFPPVISTLKVSEGTPLNQA